MLRPETMKLHGENVGTKLPDLNLGNDFLDMTLKHQPQNFKEPTEMTSN